MPSPPSRRAETRSQTRKANARDSALFLTPRRAAETLTPLTPPPTIHRPRKRPSRAHPKEEPTKERSPTPDSQATPLSFTPPVAPTTAPMGELAFRLTAKLNALREHLEAGVLPDQAQAIESHTMPSTDDSSMVFWTRVLAGLQDMCGDVEAREEQLKELTSLERRLGNTDSALAKIHQIMKDATTCPMTGRLTDSIYIIETCGHACSEEGLHGRFQTAVKKTFARLRFLSKNSIADKDIPAGPFDRDFLLKLRSRTFRPRFECYCGSLITRPPVNCWKLSELARNLHGTLGIDQEPRPTFVCRISDYFMFYDHN